ncbi:hypothetical protein Salat_0046200 [Sesamum alatum]|uniref:Uncharacterized protein n=1 Tax=Sesamum alatum TaxID=300844 RepID=A0AAE1YW53_9LAMI|nr:hypothetical protein Salat_0046200 [Sesamum alatum]
MSSSEYTLIPYPSECKYTILAWSTWRRTEEGGLVHAVPRFLRHAIQGESTFVVTRTRARLQPGTCLPHANTLPSESGEAEPRCKSAGRRQLNGRRYVEKPSGQWVEREKRPTPVKWSMPESNRRDVRALKRSDCGHVTSPMTTRAVGLRSTSDGNLKEVCADAEAITDDGLCRTRRRVPLSESSDDTENLSLSTGRHTSFSRKGKSSSGIDLNTAT